MVTDRRCKPACLALPYVATGCLAAAPFSGEFMAAKRRSKPSQDTEINPIKVGVEALILIMIREFTSEDDRFLRETCAEMLQLGDKYFDGFPLNFAGELSIPQDTLDGLADLWNEARSKDPDLTPHQFAAENAGWILEIYG